MIIPFFLPQQGCPGRCIYCNQAGLTGRQGLPGQVEIDQTVKSYLEHVRADVRSTGQHEIAFFGGSFTSLPVPVQTELLTAAKRWCQRGVVRGIRVSTRPDGIDPAVISRLQRYGVCTVELGAQTMNPAVLRVINRGHPVQATVRAVKLLRGAGFKTGVHLMTGLPGEDEAGCLWSLQEIIWLRPDFLRIHPTLVLKNSELAEKWRTGEYQPWEWGRTLRLLTKMAAWCAKARIPVVRWGLMPGELCREACLAGPFSWSLGEWVRRSLGLAYALFLVAAVRHNGRGTGPWELIVPRRDLSLITGANRWLLHHLNAASPVPVLTWRVDPGGKIRVRRPYWPFYGDWQLGGARGTLTQVTQQEFIAFF
ncbi:MAG: radical SAM protein [Heliobacteriaceae bacterium]|nr:radical SAM protein [Heliobacteriaceae bacterium]